MEAGIGNGSTSQGRLRQQLLSSEQDISNLNDGAMAGPGNGGMGGGMAGARPPPMSAGGAGGLGPYPGGFASSMEPMSPAAVANNSGSRKASMTSQSMMSMNRLFRRNKGGADGFDDEHGVDIQDLTYGSNVSFDDISHIRDRGPYAINSTKTLDTTPFIPTVGMGGGPPTARSMNNIQYRKHMNHQKKIALAQGARAMSLAGGNPMEENDGGRAMSLNVLGGGYGNQPPRAMSLNTNNVLAGGPRTMSLNTRGPVSPYNMHPNAGPRTASMRGNGYGFPMGGPPHPMYHQGAPHPMGPPGAPGHGPNFYQQPPPGSGYFPNNPQNYLQPPAGAMYNNAHMSLSGSLPSPNGLHLNTQQQPQFAKKNTLSPKDISLSPGGYRNVQLPLKSNDSLSNVVEEDEDAELNANKDLDAISENEEDVIYKVGKNESEAALLSRKSTLKKSNSMKLRKINLFDNSNEKEKEKENEEEYSGKSLPKLASARSLTMNTAFDNFRQSSRTSEGNHIEPNGKSSDSIVASGSKETEDESPSTFKSTSSKDNLETSTPGTEENYPNQPQSQNERADSYFESRHIPTKNDDTAAAFKRRTVDKMENLRNIRGGDTSDLLDSSFGDDESVPSALYKKDRKQKSLSLGSKSKNIFRRFSRSKKGADDEDSINDDFKDHNTSFRLGVSDNSGSVSNITKQTKSLTLNKDDLGIINSNKDLLDELQTVTVELASSIKRDLELRNKNKSIGLHKHSNEESLENELLEKLKIIGELQEKLNKERALRFGVEEHILLADSGNGSNVLKLNYEKTELYNQLLVKNDTINQLQEKLDETQNDRGANEDESLLYKYNEILKENAHLKFEIIPELKKQLKHGNINVSSPSRLLKLVNDTDDDPYRDDINTSHDNVEMNTLKRQRDELRETVSQLTSSYNYEIKMAQDKIKALESKLRTSNSISDKITKRLDSHSNLPSKAGSFESLTGKNNGLQGFNIVTQNRIAFNRSDN